MATIIKAITIRYSYYIISFATNMHLIQLKIQNNLTWKQTNAQEKCI